MFTARSSRAISLTHATLRICPAARFTASSIPGTTSAASLGGVNPSRSISTSASRSSPHHEKSSNSNARRLFWTAAVAGGVLSTILAQPLLAEEAASSKKVAKGGPPFTKEQIGVICIIGGPSSGKSTQLENASKKFNLIELDAKKQNLKKEIEKIVSENESKAGDEKVRVIIEGFPKTIEQANKFQDEVVPILLIISIVLDAPKGVARIKGDEILRRDAKINWKRFEDASEGLIKQFRYQGNILEITGEWPQDEVWEQVEAKLESALELDDRGEL